MAPTLEQAVEAARGKAFVILDGSLLRIDRVGMASDYNSGFYSGKHKCHGVNVQVIADPAGRLVWISPAVPGARHDIAAAREHGIIDASLTPAYGRSRTPPIRAPAHTLSSRSADGAWIATPAATETSPRRRRTSTPPTLDSEDPASGSMPS